MRVIYPTGVCPMLVAESLPIREAIRIALQLGVPQIIVENDPRTTIGSILCQS